MCLVSIIIPNYNHARYLPQRLDSVFNQTFQDFEVILLDDASTDDSVNILSEYASHPKVSHFVINSENSGSPFKQWKKGIELAKGEFIWIAESDDLCRETFLEQVLNQIQRDGQIVLSYCQSRQIDEQGRGLGLVSRHISFTDNRRWNSDFENSGESEIRKYLLHLNTIPNASAVVFRRNAFEQINQEFQEMKFYGDWYMWVQLLSVGNISYVSDVLNSFRLHRNTTRAIKKMSQQRVRLNEERIIVQKIFGISTESADECNRRIQSIEATYNSTYQGKYIMKNYLQVFREFVKYILKKIHLVNF